MAEPVGVVRGKPPEGAFGHQGREKGIPEVYVPGIPVVPVDHFEPQQVGIVEEEIVVPFQGEGIATRVKEHGCAPALADLVEHLLDGDVGPALAKTAQDGAVTAARDIVIGEITPQVVYIGDLVSHDRRHGAEPVVLRFLFCPVTEVGPGPGHVVVIGDGEDGVAPFPVLPDHAPGRVEAIAEAGMGVEVRRVPGCPGPVDSLIGVMKEDFPGGQILRQGNGVERVPLGRGARRCGRTGGSAKQKGERHEQKRRRQGSPQNRLDHGIIIAVFDWSARAGARILVAIMKWLWPGRSAVSIERKVRLVISIFAVTLIALVTLVLGHQAYRRLRVQRLEATRQSLVLVRDKMELLGESLDHYSLLISASPAVQEVLEERRHAQGPPPFEVITRLQGPMNSIVYPRSKVDSLIIYDHRGYRFSSGFLSAVEGLPDEARQRLLKDRGSLLWRPTHSSEHTRDGRPLPLLSLARAIYSWNTGVHLGFVEIHLAERTLAGLYQEVSLGPGGKICLVDHQGRIISAPDTDRLFTRPGIIEAALPATTGSRGWESIQISRGQSILFMEPLPATGWAVAGVIPRGVVFRDLLPALLGFGFLGVLAVAITLVAARVIASWFSRPLRAMAETMNDVASGDMEVRVEVTSQDEVGQLARTFNAMLDKTSALLEEIRHSHEAEREQALEAMRLRMNPHFLYNTLDTVAGLAERGAVGDIPPFIQTLCRFYRRVLGEGRGVSTIGEELALCDDYLKLLQVRYRGGFSWSIAADPEVSGIPLPRMLLQPVVENAIFHGLKPMVPGGVCHITADSGARGALIRVQDNGVGFSPRHQKEGFGLSSVRQRLEAAFGLADLVSVSSAPGQGTEVTILIPRAGGYAAREGGLRQG